MPPSPEEQALYAQLRPRITSSQVAQARNDYLRSGREVERAAELRRRCFDYKNTNRSPGEWGAPIELNHKNAIVFAVEMDHDMVRQAPDAHTTTETAFKYLEVGKIAMTVARYIHFLGYEARAHVDGNYRVLCVPLAQDAGLGELGRLGLLITPEMGPRIRLAVVTTDLPLAQDPPIHFSAPL